MLVLSSTNIADIFNIPTYLFGALFLSICTTSPEFVIELKVIFGKSAPIAFVDIFGSIICNNSLVIAIAVLINPILIDKTSFYTVGVFMFVVVAISAFFMKKEVIKRWEGILLFLIYVLFVVVQISYLMGKGLFYGLI